jgi:hypothetical protein
MGWNRVAIARMPTIHRVDSRRSMAYTLLALANHQLYLSECI